MKLELNRHHRGLQIPTSSVEVSKSTCSTYICNVSPLFYVCLKVANFSLVFVHPTSLYKQEIEEGSWHVKSVSGNNPAGYTVMLLHTTCQECSPLSPQVDEACTASECHFLCPHMYKCSRQCYDFNNGHICKHIHRVHSLRLASGTCMNGSNSTSQQMLHLTQPLSSNEVEDHDILDDLYTDIAYAESVFDPKKGWLQTSQKSTRTIHWQVILCHVLLRSHNSAQHISHLGPRIAVICDPSESQNTTIPRLH